MSQINFVRFIFAAGFLFWTFVIIAAFFISGHYMYKNKLELARSVAGIAIQKDVQYRHLFASLDRVYVPRQPGIEPNPFLDSAQKKIIANGQELVQLNPAYIVRLLHEKEGKDRVGVRGSLVSLDPLNPKNSPDIWQKKALQAFDAGEDSAFTVQKVGDTRYLRLIKALPVKKECLSCHARQGYKVGDIRGGISVTMPMSPYEKALQKDRLILFLSLGLVWMTGTIGLVILGHQLIRRVRERDVFAADLQYLSFHDSLTGLYNRFAFDHEMDRLQKGRHESIAVIVCDVDGLKKVNDELGHARGDRLIKDAAENIAAPLRKGDMLARIGGDEFAILLPEIGEEQCRDLVARIRAAIERFNSEYPDEHLSISLGYYVWVQGEEKDLNAVFKEADDHMFRDKAAKRSSR